MDTGQLCWSEAAGWRETGAVSDGADLVLYFGTRQALAGGARYREMRAMFPAAHIMGCSTGGQIRDDDITDSDIAAVALRFAATRLRLACEPAASPAQSQACGAAIGRALAADDLAGIFILSDGLNVNGSALVAGVIGAVGSAVPVTGGLAGDGPAFCETLVGADAPPAPRTVAAIGFYGPAVRIGHGSAGGWDNFGPRRRITRAAGNVLFELDGSPALDLYKRYMDEDDVRDLPGSALLFPLRVYDPDNPAHDVVRTILAVDHAARSLTFAGDVPTGWTAQLMRGNFDNLAAGAAKAARQAAMAMNGSDNGVAVLVSCIGRRLLMGQQAIDEVEAVGAEIGARVARLGFYSYGEISPHSATGVCELHNQTMTVTTITEATG